MRVPSGRITVRRSPGGAGLIQHLLRRLLDAVGDTKPVQERLGGHNDLRSDVAVVTLLDLASSVVQEVLGLPLGDLVTTGDDGQEGAVDVDSIALLIESDGDAGLRPAHGCGYSASCGGDVRHGFRSLGVGAAEPMVPGDGRPPHPVAECGGLIRSWVSALAEVGERVRSRLGVVRIAPAASQEVASGPQGADGGEGADTKHDRGR